VERDWSFFSNHGLALLAVARRPDSRIRDVAGALGITERAAQGILSELVQEGYLERVRVGRRNRYIVREERMLRHPTTRDHSVAELVRALGVKGPTGPSGRARGRAG
jgi:predicted ArsR family transcriptional regulator